MEIKFRVAQNNRDTDWNKTIPICLRSTGIMCGHLRVTHSGQGSRGRASRVVVPRPYPEVFAAWMSKHRRGRWQ